MYSTQHESVVKKKYNAPHTSETHTFCHKSKSFSQHTLSGYSENVRTHRLWSVRSLLYSGNSKFLLRSSSGQLTTPQHLVPNLWMREAVLAVPQNAFIATKEATSVLRILLYLKKLRVRKSNFFFIFQVRMSIDIHTVCVY